jgi:hypothetical protein
MYKIYKSGNRYSLQIEGKSIPVDPANSDYQQFVQDVVEQGTGIVEGPDVVEPSYAELRGAEYPSREDQLDMIYWDKVNGTTIWEDTIQQIKDRYPKTITGGTTVGSVPTWVQEAADNWTYNKQLREYVAAVETLASNPDEETRDAAQAVIDRTPNSIIDSINN